MLAAKLRTYLRPKCHPLLLDGSINSPATVRLNVYQVSLLTQDTKVAVPLPTVCSEPQGPAALKLPDVADGTAGGHEVPQRSSQPATTASKALALHPGSHSPRCHIPATARAQQGGCCLRQVLSSRIRQSRAMVGHDIHSGFLCKWIS